MAAMTASDPVLQNVARSMPVSSQIDLGEFPGDGRLRPDFHAGAELFFDRVDQPVRRVAEEVGAEAHGDIDVFVAVDVPDAARPCCAAETIG